MVRWQMKEAGKSKKTDKAENEEAVGRRWAVGRAK